jgi:hypothetical protein
MEQNENWFGSKVRSWEGQGTTNLSLGQISNLLIFYPALAFPEKNLGWTVPALAEGGCECASVGTAFGSAETHVFSLHLGSVRCAPPANVWMVAHRVRCNEVGGLAMGRSLTNGEVRSWTGGDGRSWTVVSSMGIGGEGRSWTGELDGDRDDGGVGPG